MNDLQVALPLLGIMSTGEVAINYLNSTNYMFLGGELFKGIGIDLLFCCRLYMAPPHPYLVSLHRQVTHREKRHRERLEWYTN
jgi:hypothetical protein